MIHLSSWLENWIGTPDMYNIGIIIDYIVDPVSNNIESQWKRIFQVDVDQRRTNDKESDQDISMQKCWCRNQNEFLIICYVFFNYPNQSCELEKVWT